MTDISVLRTELVVNSQIRTAARFGVVLTVLHKGDLDRGTLLLKLNLLNGQFRLYGQLRRDAELGWTLLLSGENREGEAMIDARIERERSLDRDLWAIEIEDRKGRLWFPGRVWPDEA